MFTLAQLPAPGSASSVGWILLSLAALCVAINAIASFWRENIRGNPPPSTTYATKDEHRQFQLQMDQELGRERGSRKKMHEEIAELFSGQEALKKETENQTRQLSEMKAQIGETQRRIDDVPSRTIALLNTTKALHS